mmetsp:Transcript_18838/g.27856  ORF Transcript_18838/g.27856 Transcript_18838/m.27856 type:complete len:151 (+) Transcript_18838:78-530(+)
MIVTSSHFQMELIHSNDGVTYLPCIVSETSVAVLFVRPTKLSRSKSCPPSLQKIEWAQLSKIRVMLLFLSDRLESVLVDRRALVNKRRSDFQTPAKFAYLVSRKVKEYYSARRNPSVAQIYELPNDLYLTNPTAVAFGPTHSLQDACHPV